MSPIIRSERFTLLVFFVLVILAGSILLFLPGAWNGKDRLSYLDALFTATSAVCVTGLITVDTTQYTLFGKLVIMTLIQVGGLGIMSFATLYLVTPGLRLSLVQTRIIQDYYVEAVEHRERTIIRSIVLFTLLAETIGAALLFIRFVSLQHSGVRFADGVFLTAAFHSVSAFCNAGFSLFSNSLQSYSGDTILLLTIMALIVLGGLGFVVIHDLIQRFRGRTRALSLHSRIVLVMTLVLVAGGAGGFYLLERGGSLAATSEPFRWLGAFFQSVTTRTAGFDAIPQAGMTPASKTLTMFLMFTGGAPGSIAGGVKVTTMLLVFTAVFRGTYKEGSVTIGRRQVPGETVSNAHLFVLRAVALVVIGTFALAVTELTVANARWTFLDIAFEVFSAFGTVGLSTGITPALSAAGKMIVILVMFAGRVGLIFVTLTQSPENLRHNIEYASERVMLG